MRRPLVRLVAVGLLASAAGAFVAVIQDHAPLWADPQCTCTRTAGMPTFPCTMTCVRYGAIASETCTPSGINDPCLILGVASWSPWAPTSCAESGSQTGVISPIGSSNAAFFWFDASTQNPSIPFGYYSGACTSVGTVFGWGMAISHKTVATTSPCTCSGNYSPNQCGISVWLCKY